MVCKKLIAFHNLNDFPMVSIFIRFGLQMGLKINGFTEIKRFGKGLGKGGINGYSGSGALASRVAGVTTVNTTPICSSTHAMWSLPGPSSLT